MSKSAALVIKILSGMLFVMGVNLVAMYLTEYTEAPTWLSGLAAIIMSGSLFFMATYAGKQKSEK